MSQASRLPETAVINLADEGDIFGDISHSKFIRGNEKPSIAFLSSAVQQPQDRLISQRSSLPDRTSTFLRRPDGASIIIGGDHDYPNLPRRAELVAREPVATSAVSDTIAYHEHNFMKLIPIGFALIGVAFGAALKYSTIQTIVKGVIVIPPIVFLIVIILYVRRADA